LSRGEDSLPDRALPIDSGDGRIDLADDDIEHSVEELLFVGHMLVEGHRYDAQLIGEPSHAERLDPGAVCQGYSGAQHAIPAQGDPARRLGFLSHLTKRTPYTYTPGKVYGVHRK